MKLRGAAVVLLGACLLSNEARAAGPVELTPHIGVQVGGFATQGPRNVDIKTGISYGFAADYRLLPYLYLRAGYHRVETSALIWSDAELTASSIPLSQGHLLFGPTYEHGLGRIRAVLGVGVGATHVTPRAAPYDPEWYFAGAVEAALKVAIIENLGARVHTRLLMSPVSDASPFFCPVANVDCEYNLGADVLGQGEFGVGVWLAF